HRPARRHDQQGHPRRAARREELPAAGRGRPDDRVALDLRRSGLPGGRARALLAREHRPRQLPRHLRRGGDGGVRPALAHRGHHPGDRVLARPGRRARARSRAGRGRCPTGGRDTARQPVGAWRQGRGDRDRVVRPHRGRRPRPARRRRGGRPMTRTSGAAIDDARAQGRAALVVYLPVGYPDVATSIEAARTAVAAGADVVELGLPYSDPGMDGPVVAAAAQAALDGGVRTADVLHAVEQVAATGAATLVMTYYNPVLRYGVET